MTRLIDDFFAVLARINRPVLTDVSGLAPVQVSGLELNGYLDRTATWLSMHGAGFGSGIVALCDNNLETALLLLAAMRHGITVIVQQDGTSASAIDTIVGQTGAGFILNLTGKPQADAWPEFRLEMLEGIDATAPRDIPEDMPFLVTFSSGSTGEPKGIVHAARSLISCGASFNEQTGITADDVFLNVMPMYYMAGIFNGIIAPLQQGASVVIDAGFNVQTAMTFWGKIRDRAITALWLSPTMLSLVVRLDRTDKIIPPGFRHLFVGTGAMTAEDGRNFHATYGLAPQQSYGLSELLYISVDNRQSPVFGSVGKPLDTLRVGFDDDGTLLIDTEHLFLGYLVDGKPSLPAQPFRTTDIGRMAEDGTLHIEGRTDDIIVRGGVNVNPVVLEDALRASMANRRFCISARPDKALGNSIVLVLEGTLEGDQEVFLRARKDIAQAFNRTGIDALAHLEDMPVGPTGKIRRSAVRELLAQT